MRIVAFPPIIPMALQMERAGTNLPIVTKKKQSQQKRDTFLRVITSSTPWHFSTSDNRQEKGCRLNGFVAKKRCLTTRATVSAPIVGGAGSIFIDESVPPGSVSVILLAGGVGKRMGASMPKQYLPLLDLPIALYSLEMFSNMPEVAEVVVVCESQYKPLFLEAQLAVVLKFVLPGKERQDSVFNGLQAIRPHSQLVAIHDSARPLITAADTRKVLSDGMRHGAAVLGVRVKATIKQAGKNGFVEKTLERSSLWEMQTPQVLRPELLRKGFELVNREKLDVTDDVSIVEHLNHPVWITEGSYTNIKVTTPEDLLLAERILSHTRQEVERQSETNPSILPC